jgi:hypothetical protein
VALALYPRLPDVDVILRFGDGCTAGMSIVSWNLCGWVEAPSGWERVLGF